MNNVEKALLIMAAENGTDEESNLAMTALRELDSTYHFCLEWDGMVICKEDPEFEACICQL